MINDILTEADDKMGKSVESTREDFGAIRAGRVNPSMFSKLTRIDTSTIETASSATINLGDTVRARATDTRWR